MRLQKEKKTSRLLCCENVGTVNQSGNEELGFVRDWRRTIFGGVILGKKQQALA